MTKNEYLRQLRRCLRQLSRQEMGQSLAYYSELIDDRMESGMGEDEAVASMDPPESAAAQLLEDAAQRGALKPRSSTVSAALIIAGSPQWLVFAIVAGAVILALYVVVWAVIVSVAAAVAAVAVSGIALIAAAISGFSGGIAPAAYLLGCGLMCAGIALALYTPVISLIRLTIKWTARVFRNSVNKLKGGACNA